METTEILSNNLALLEKITPQVAFLLRSYTCFRTQLCQTRQEELNLCINEGEYVHSPCSALKEAEEWFSSLQLKETQVLYVYGIGLGYYYEVAKKWLDESMDRYLVFLEDDLEILYRCLETERGCEILLHKQVQIHYFSSLEKVEPVLNWLFWFFIMTSIDISALRHYREKKGKIFHALSARIYHDSVRINTLGKEYLNGSRHFYRNFYANLLYLDQSYHGAQLFDQFKDIPAIICGAGPSLNTNIDQLPSLYNRALLFAGSSSLNVLNAGDVLPHFGAGIDPNPAQYQRVSTNQAYEVPFFYRSRLFHQALRSIHGPRLYINGTGGYSLAAWIEEELGIQGPSSLDEGYNVITFCTNIAYHLGCNPIIFVGMDLAFTDFCSYADGVVAKEDRKMQKERLVDPLSRDGGAFLRNGVDGKPLYTLWKWVSESEWIGDHAKEHKEVTYINATEGGIGFPDIPNYTLKEVSEKYLHQEYPLGERVHSAMQRAHLPDITFERILSVVDKLKQSLERCDELCNLYLKETQKIEKRFNQGKTIPASLKTSQAIAYELELKEEIAYRHIIHDIHQVRDKIQQRRYYQILHDHRIPSERERQRKHFKVNQENVQFIQITARTNLGILNQAVNEIQRKRKKNGRLQNALNFFK